MVSSTKQTTRRRQLRSSQRGRWNKKLGASTPVFPVQPPGYDATAPDAKPAKKATEGGASRRKITMANHPSAAKRNRQRVKRTVRNRNVRAAVRTAVKKARAAIAAGGADAKAIVDAAALQLSKAASAGVVHTNAASRVTSRINAALHKSRATST